MTDFDAAYYVNKYGMQPHPEGGYYLETYRSAEAISRQALPFRFSGDRALATAILFLLEEGTFSAFHRIQADELWHFYTGGPIEVFVVDPADASVYTIRLGNNPDNGEVFQAVVPAGAWFASAPASETEFCLVGCTVAPGFDFDDFELAERSELIRRYPEHEALITRFTRS